MFRAGSFLLLVVFSAGLAAPPNHLVQKDLALFQGPWQAAAIQQADGLPSPEADVRETTLLVEGATFTLKSREVGIAGTFTIDPAKTPKAIDVVLHSENGKKTVLLGIYRIEGDTRTSRFALPGAARPTQFTSEKGYIGFEWKRK